jgi:hypothetical protein
MFEVPTLFVVGAGASADFNLPVGETLAEQIASIAGDAFKWQHCQTDEGDLIVRYVAGAADTIDVTKGDMKVALGRIADGVRQGGSIDRFIDSFPDEPSIAVAGKALIALAIMRAEGASKIASAIGPDQSLNLYFDGLQTTWLYLLQRLLFANVRRLSCCRFNGQAVRLT